MSSTARVLWIMAATGCRRWVNQNAATFGSPRSCSRGRDCCWHLFWAHDYKVSCLGA